MNMTRERLKDSAPAKFFFAIAGGRESYRPEAESLLAACCGELDSRSALYRFSDFSTYYDEETGGPVWKYLVGVKDLLHPEELVRIKHETERIQAGFAREIEGRLGREINIDPGYLNGWQVVLASVKNFTHRIYLSAGVYAETTLLYQKGGFLPLPWTYADYLSDPVLSFLAGARKEWSRQGG